mmetsp:Transcript_10939/g.30226  ORF Transcript_10939/g.30226 Transcript_10939/m.30226 type:complete len:281 (+) Transcript_10939:1114-1956(+)
MFYSVLFHDLCNTRLHSWRIAVLNHPLPGMHGTARCIETEEAAKSSKTSCSKGDAPAVGHYIYVQEYRVESRRVVWFGKVQVQRIFTRQHCHLAAVQILRGMQMRHDSDLRVVARLPLCMSLFRVVVGLRHLQRENGIRRSVHGISRIQLQPAVDGIPHGVAEDRHVLGLTVGFAWIGRSVVGDGVLVWRQLELGHVRDDHLLDVRRWMEDGVEHVVVESQIVVIRLWLVLQDPMLRLEVDLLPEFGSSPALDVTLDQPDAAIAVVFQQVLHLDAIIVGS